MENAPEMIFFLFSNPTLSRQAKTKTVSQVESGEKTPKQRYDYTHTLRKSLNGFPSPVGKLSCWELAKTKPGKTSPVMLGAFKIKENKGIKMKCKPVSKMECPGELEPSRSSRRIRNHPDPILYSFECDYCGRKFTLEEIKKIQESKIVLDIP